MSLCEEKGRKEERKAGLGGKVKGTVNSGTCQREAWLWL